ncbi:hypothetical protein AB0L34_21785 [Micromonospora sp. NPDC052213]|uniref:hypothetical protein n=1 Tax=Micromonospora sp. NPDC052213 TaxID=3155812 RepID=UPI00342A2D99
MSVTGRERDEPGRLEVPASVIDQLDSDWIASGLGEHLETAKTTRGLELLTPDASKEDEPFTYAIVVNTPVDLQVNVALTSLASLLSRREVVEKLLRTNAFEGLDDDLQQSDQQARENISDTTRIHGWKIAARQLRDRSRMSGHPLRVTFEAPLFTQRDLAVRAPALRRVYNEMSIIRLAIDKVAALLSQGMTVVGSGSDKVMRMSLDMLDLGDVRTYLAHLARDAYVCGNGFLAFGSPPETALRLIQPEKGQLDQTGAKVRTSEGSDWLRVLHVRGAEQVGSMYGLGMVEPFISQVSMHDVLIGRLYTARSWTLWDRAPSSAKDWAATVERSVPRMIKRVQDQIKASLGTVTEGLTDPPQDLYFPGRERMMPAPSLFMNSDESAENLRGSEKGSQ